MAQDMFVMPIPILEKTWRAALVFVFLIALIRIMGNRPLLQLSTIDFIVFTLTIASVQNALIGADSSVLGGLLGATVVAVLGTFTIGRAFRSPSIQRLIQGSPRVLILNGRLSRNLIREGISRGGLLSKLQGQGVSSFDDVELCVLEPSGTLTVEARGTTVEIVADMSKRLDEAIEKLDAIAAELNAGRPT